MLPLFGSGNLIRTDDNTGMNRVLYQLSYAAMKLYRCRNSTVIIIEKCLLVKHFSANFQLFFFKGIGKTTAVGTGRIVHGSCAAACSQSGFGYSGGEC